MAMRRLDMSGVYVDTKFRAHTDGKYISRMALDPRTPVIVGVGQHLQRIDDPLQALAPAPFIAEAIRIASRDAGLASIPDVDSLRVVGFLSWRYRDPARFIAEELGISTRETVITSMGGNSPQSLMNATALEIQSGSFDLVVLCGGETSRTRKRARSANIDLPWPNVPEDIAPTRVMGEQLVMNHEYEISRQIVAPVQVYPIFESALRASAGRSIPDHNRRLGELWSRFSSVAASNPYAWIRTPLTPDEIITPSPRNRMIGLPYTKVMNSNNDVDQSAAIIMCSVARAQSLGIPRDRWVFPISGTDCHEHKYVSMRQTFHETPAIRLGGRLALELAETSIDDIDIIDLYSCFPSAVQLGAESLGLSLDRQLTRTGGLSFAGGPWNNYVMHAIATVVGELRERPGEKGLIWANGGYATKHAFGVYSATPPTSGFRHANPQDRIDALPKRNILDVGASQGPATIEGYTVMHDREGRPERAIATVLDDNGDRAWGVSDDHDTTSAMCEGEWVGRRIRLDEKGTLIT
jgi:acetyl-CoA C-acetyltransferase